MYVHEISIVMTTMTQKRFVSQNGVNNKLKVKRDKVRKQILSQRK